MKGDDGAYLSYQAYRGGGGSQTTGGSGGIGSNTDYYGKAGEFGIGGDTGYHLANSYDYTFGYYTTYDGNGAGRRRLVWWRCCCKL